MRIQHPQQNRGPPQPYAIHYAIFGRTKGVFSKIVLGFLNILFCAAFPSSASHWTVWHFSGYLLSYIRSIRIHLMTDTWKIPLSFFSKTLEPFFGTVVMFGLFINLGIIPCIFKMVWAACVRFTKLSVHYWAKLINQICDVKTGNRTICAHGRTLFAACAHTNKTDGSMLNWI